METFKIVRASRIVAYGVKFPAGKCAVHWVGPYSSVVVWDSFDDLQKINGQPGTTFVFDKM